MRLRSAFPRIISHLGTNLFPAKGAFDCMSNDRVMAEISVGIRYCIQHQTDANEVDKLVNENPVSIFRLL